MTEHFRINKNSFNRISLYVIFDKFIHCLFCKEKDRNNTFRQKVLNLLLANSFQKTQKLFYVYEENSCMIQTISHLSPNFFLDSLDFVFVSVIIKSFFIIVKHLPNLQSFLITKNCVIKIFICFFLLK